MCDCSEELAYGVRRVMSNYENEHCRLYKGLISLIYSKTTSMMY